jgi:hypothetical protein
VIRTRRVPFFHSRPSRPLLATTITIVLIGLALPYTPLAHTSSSANENGLHKVVGRARVERPARVGESDRILRGRCEGPLGWHRSRADGATRCYHQPTREARLQGTKRLQTV